MPNAEKRLLAAVRGGDVGTMRLALADLPSGWLRSHGDATIALAQGYGHLGLLDLLCAEMSSSAATELERSQLDAAYVRSLQQARASVAATHRYAPTRTGLPASMRTGTRSCSTRTTRCGR